MSITSAFISTQHTHCVSTRGNVLTWLPLCPGEKMGRASVQQDPRAPGDRWCHTPALQPLEGALGSNRRPTVGLPTLRRLPHPPTIRTAGWGNDSVVLLHLPHTPRPLCGWFSFTLPKEFVGLFYFCVLQIFRLLNLSITPVQSSGTTDVWAKCASVEAAAVVPAAAGRRSRHNELSVQDQVFSSSLFRGDPATSVREVVDGKLPRFRKGVANHVFFFKPL